MNQPAERRVRPQTAIFEKGYDPRLSEGAAVTPIFRTSTFVFESAAAGKRAFEIAYGLAEAGPGEVPALIYTRVNNPNAEMVEDKVVAWDGAEAAALFSSGMGAISATCLAFLRPGDTLLFSDPVYGGTEKFQADPHWRDLVLFYEYFHGDNGAGLGASHQTGWTGLVARIMHLFATTTPEQWLDRGRVAAGADVPEPRSAPVGAK